MLLIEENLQFFGWLFGYDVVECCCCIDVFMFSIGLWVFFLWLVGKFLGGMKQKLVLCCVLIYDLDFLILDELIMGVDLFLCMQFWDLIVDICVVCLGMSVIVVIVYMEEVECFDWLVVMDVGQVFVIGMLVELCSCVGIDLFEVVFIVLLLFMCWQGY